ncbi:MFS transporter [Streptomyces coffeae]|uniref:MFS transporter n=1 Tax=Streptomyces coffeae TaxID=621382 RepID=A0ABS1NPC9_9ACTN|nr:MFS transporter [Streptomyces coffeae]MBL1101933.1 MFS transporter [Streptomyces coffeae]
MKRWTASTRLLRDPRFRRFYIGYFASLFGTGMEAVGVAFAVLDSGHSAAGLGYVLTAGVAANVCCLLAGGVIADRFSRRTVMLCCDTVRCAGEASFAALILFGHPPLYWLIILYMVQNAAAGFYMPALGGLTPQLVAADDLHDANTYLGLARDIGRVLGPAAAGAVAAALEPGAVLAIDALTFAVSAITLVSIRVPAKRGKERHSPVRDLADGWHAWRSRPWIWITSARFALFNSVVYAPLIVLGPALAKERFGGADDWGIVLTALGIGAVATGPVIMGRSPSRPLVVLTAFHVTWALPLLALALDLPLAVIAGGALLAGTGSAVFNAVWSSTLQRHVPAEVMARITSLSTLCSYAPAPLGLAVAASVADAVGADNVLLFGAGWHVLSVLVVLALPTARRFTGETPTPPARTAEPVGTKSETP